MSHFAWKSIDARSWWRLTSLLVSFFLLVPVSDGFGDDPKSQDAIWKAEALRLGRAEAGLYRIVARDQPEVVAKLQDKPALAWSNPNNATVHGNVFIWTQQGRPVAVASIYKFFTTKDEFAAELHSLSTQPLVAEKKGQPVWQPETAGIKLVDFPGAPEPAKTPVQRLRQMRELAGQFSGDVFQFDNDERNGLRLLPTPLYRYSPETPQTDNDGAVFAFVTATDPEAILVLQSHRSAGKLVWQYGFARMSVGRIQIRLGKSEVWSVDKMKLPATERNKPYCLFEWLPDPGELPKPVAK